MAATTAVIAENDVRASVDSKAIILVDDRTFGDSLPGSLTHDFRRAKSNGLQYRYQLRRIRQCYVLRVYHRYLHWVQLLELFKGIDIYQRECDVRW